MADWTKGRGLLGPMKPLLGEWTTVSGGGDQNAMTCTRTFKPFGKQWIELDARWEMGSRGTYREIALFGASDQGALGFHSFTNDGKRSAGTIADGSDVHPQALAFEAQMPAGLARMIYWPDESGAGFYFAVESKTKKGWNRFMRHKYQAV